MRVYINSDEVCFLSDAIRRFRKEHSDNPGAILDGFQSMSYKLRVSGHVIRLYINENEVKFLLHSINCVKTSDRRVLNGMNSIHAKLVQYGKVS